MPETFDCQLFKEKSNFRTLCLQNRYFMIFSGLLKAFEFNEETFKLEESPIKLAQID